MATAMWTWMEYMDVVAQERKDKALEAEVARLQEEVCATQKETASLQGRLKQAQQHVQRVHEKSVEAQAELEAEVKRLQEGGVHRAKQRSVPS